MKTLWGSVRMIFGNKYNQKYCLTSFENPAKTNLKLKGKDKLKSLQKVKSSKQIVRREIELATITDIDSESSNDILNTDESKKIKPEISDVISKYREHRAVAGKDIIMDYFKRGKILQIIIFSNSSQKRKQNHRKRKSFWLSQRTA